MYNPDTQTPLDIPKGGAFHQRDERKHPGFIQVGAPQGVLSEYLSILSSRDPDHDRKETSDHWRAASDVPQ